MKLNFFQNCIYNFKSNFKLKYGTYCVTIKIFSFKTTSTTSRKVNVLYWISKLHSPSTYDSIWRDEIQAFYFQHFVIFNVRLFALTAELRSETLDVNVKGSLCFAVRTYTHTKDFFVFSMRLFFDTSSYFSPMIFRD